MKRFYCNGKKNFCDEDMSTWGCDDCDYFDGEFGEWIDVPDGATALWFFLFCLKMRFHDLWYKIRRK